jgi:hemin uptake protein HemP
MKPNTTYTLSNLLGQEVQSGFLEFQKNQIVINKELQGVYLLKITQDGKSATTKLIIK